MSRKTKLPPRPRPPIVGAPLGRAARLLSARPVTWCGGHSFSLSKDGRVGWCMGCYRACPVWAITEGMWAPHFLDRWCPGLFIALPAAVA